MGIIYILHTERYTLMDTMDIVYVLKKADDNPNLKYSLRSLVNVSGYNRVWFSGYCPTWTKPDGYILTRQNKSKWLNSLTNVIAACENDNITEDFILFNDDFFAIHPIHIDKHLSYCNSTLDTAIINYHQTKDSTWKNSHAQSKQLLKALGSTHFDNFAIHTPMIINRKHFLEIIHHPLIQNFIKTHSMLSYRNIYGNMYWVPPKNIMDVKLRQEKDIDDYFAKSVWISVPADATALKNINHYPRLKQILLALPKSQYER